MNQETGLKINWNREWGAGDLLVQAGLEMKHPDGWYSGLHLKDGFDQSSIDYQCLVWLDYFSIRFPELRFIARAEKDWLETCSSTGLFTYSSDSTFAEENVPVICVGVNYFSENAVSVEEWIQGLFHEVGHHVMNRLGRKGVENEFCAWKWAEKEMKKLGLLFHQKHKIAALVTHAKMEEFLKNLMNNNEEV